MKCKLVELILNPEDAARAGAARLAKEDDMDVTTQEQAKAYRGSCFVQDGIGCKELHIKYFDGVACVNFKNEDNEHVSYDYPLHTLKRVKRIAG